MDYKIIKLRKHEFGRGEELERNGVKNDEIILYEVLKDVIIRGESILFYREFKWTLNFSNRKYIIPPIIYFKNWAKDVVREM